MNGAGLGHQLRARRLTKPAQDQDQNVLAAAEQEGAEHDRDAELDEQSEDVSFAPPRGIRRTWNTSAPRHEVLFQHHQRTLLAPCGRGRHRFGHGD
jgi:hypothetical protein